MTVADFLKPWRLACSSSDDLTTILRDCITTIKPTLITLGVIVLILGWVYAAIKLILGAFSPEAQKGAKDIIIYTAIGFAIILVADIIASFVLYVLTP